MRRGTGEMRGVRGEGRSEGRGDEGRGVRGEGHREERDRGEMREEGRRP